MFLISDITETLCELNIQLITSKLLFFSNLEISFLLPLFIAYKIFKNYKKADSLFRGNSLLHYQRKKICMTN